MRKTVVTVICLFASSVVLSAERRISVADYRDRMKAGWIGQSAGVAWGAPTEFNYKYKLIPEDKVPVWTPAMVNNTFHQDDLYVEMTFLQTLETKGLDVSSREAGIDFANSEYFLWHANAEGRRSLRKGIAPPDSGHPQVNNCANDIDYQIEADYSGLIAPGCPQRAVRLGETFGSLMNYGDGLYAGQFIGAMYAEAFFEKDPVKIVKSALKAIPAECRYARMVRDMLETYAKDPKDWESAWKMASDTYGHEKDCKVDPSVIDATLNGAYVLLGLLWGDGDPDQTIIISMRAGFDSDCNPSNAAGVLFTALGMKGVPSKFYSGLDLTKKFSYTPYTFDGLVDACVGLARKVVVAEGGRIEKVGEEEVFVIPVRDPKPSAYVDYRHPAPITGARYSQEEMDRIKFLPRLKNPPKGKSGAWGVKSELKDPPTTSDAKVEPWQMFNRRLGMFVHWGIYSAGGLHEQEQMRYGRTREEYNKRMQEFTAEKFTGDNFIDVAESAGAEYIVITTKHHDGFCMWNTKTTDFNVMNSAAKRDLIGELAAACKRRGMKLGFYFSNPDWHQPFAHNDKSSHQIGIQPGDVPDREKYIAMVKAQVTELLTNYGEIACFFWDIPSGIEMPEMDEMVRKLQPGIMINDRGWGNKKTCDYSTPERDYKWALGNRHVEACDAVGVHSWGYRVNEDYRTTGYLTRNIDRYLSTGGNYLLNVGPKADGTIPEEAVKCMKNVGAWYAKVRESYRDVQPDTNLVSSADITVTRRGNTAYLHFRKPLESNGLFLWPMDTMPKSATVLNSGTELKTVVELDPWAWRKDRAPSILHLMGIPADDLANECVVIRLDLDAVEGDSK